MVDEIADAWRAELPGVTGVGLELSKRAARLSALLTVPVEAELSRLGLTKAEYDVLAVLRSSGEPYRLRPSVLAQRLVLTSGGVSNVLRRLESADLIERDPDPADARSSWVRLSERGVRIAETAVRAASAAQAARLRDLPPETAQRAIDALRAALIALGDAVPDGERSSRPAPLAGGRSSRPAAPVDGGSTRPAAPVDGGSSRPAAPVDGTSSRPAAPVDGTSSRPAAPVDGTSSRPAAAADGRSSRPAAAADGGSSRPAGLGRPDWA